MFYGGRGSLLGLLNDNRNRVIRSSLLVEREQRSETKTDKRQLGTITSSISPTRSVLNLKWTEVSIDLKSGHRLVMDEACDEAGRARI